MDPFDYEGIKAAIKENTKAIEIETLGNPNSEVVDIEKIANIAHEAGIPLIWTIPLLHHTSFVRLSTVLISWFTQLQSSSVDTEQQSAESSSTAVNLTEHRMINGLGL